LLVDSHCHLDFPELAGNLDDVFALMAENGVGRALCVAVTLQDFPQVRALAESRPDLYATVGVHPDYEGHAVDVQELVRLAAHPKVIGIGETGLDYYRLKGDLSWQRERFRTHIRAARECGKPLVIHTRAAAEDTLAIMREERAGDIGGVMHCFTESWEVASAAMDLGFYISFSGIITFKNARELREVARQIPLERALVETDAPYLAPVPFRGRTNQPGYVRHVAAELARIQGADEARVEAETTTNFMRLFNVSGE